MKPSIQILDSAAECFGSARKNLMEGAKLLYEISTGELWKERHDSFGAYVEEECKISQGMASKLVNVYGYFVLKAGVPHAKLTSIDTEKLYLAMSLPGTPLKQLASAESLTRSEIRAELKDPEDKCLHEKCFKICSNCHKRV
jgi:hypothetical protein